MNKIDPHIGLPVGFRLSDPGNDVRVDRGDYERDAHVQEYQRQKQYYEEDKHLLRLNEMFGDSPVRSELLALRAELRRLRSHHGC